VLKRLLLGVAAGAGGGLALAFLSRLLGGGT
jgi:hypothetical protein